MGEVGRQAAKAAGAAEKATESRGFVLAARVGFVAAGLLHVMIGVIALRIASGGSGTADQSGAIQELATTPGGGVLLWICFLGCVALALFLLAQALVGAGRRRGREQTKARLKAAARPWCTAQSVRPSASSPSAARAAAAAPRSRSPPPSWPTRPGRSC